MANVEMVVSLKVPDNVAITAFNTLKRMGYNDLIELGRSDYYKFEIAGNDAEKFKKEISNVDILVNANKHKFLFSIEKNRDNDKNNQKNKEGNAKINVLVQDLGNENGLLQILKERLGFNNIKKIEKGVLWKMHFDKNTNAGKVAADITKNLLMNENYQKYKLV